MICTDVAARGLDIKGLPYIINVTLPDEKSNYVHRIGRVGRAERMGLAISLVAQVPEKVNEPLLMSVEQSDRIWRNFATWAKFNYSLAIFVRIGPMFNVVKANY